MRTIKQIESLIEKIDAHQAVLTKGTPEAQWLSAIDILGINPISFASIVFKKGKIQYVNDRVLCSELEFCIGRKELDFEQIKQVIPDNETFPACVIPVTGIPHLKAGASSNKLNSTTQTALFALVQQAKAIVLNSPLIRDHEDRYSRHCIGLSDIGVRANTQNPCMDLIKIGPKKEGVEPGYEGVLISDILHLLQKQYPDPKARANYIKQHQGNILSIYHDIKRQCHELPRYMVKLDFQVMKSNGKVRPEEKDLMRTEAYKAVPKLTVAQKPWLSFYGGWKEEESYVKNSDAVLELVANDILGIFQGNIEAQKQTLYKTEYDNGKLKILLKGEFITGAKTLGPLHGAQDEFNVYRVSSVEYSINSIKYLSKNNIPHFGRLFLPILSQEDYDGIGRKGQNKLEKDNKLFVIDCGHAYSAKNRVVHTLQHDFQFTHIFKNENFFGKPIKFKSYACFFDAPRRELMQGAFLMAKLNGEKLDSEVVKSYGVDFVKTLATLNRDDDIKIFEHYKQFIASLKRQDHNNAKDYDAILKRLEESQLYAEEAKRVIVEKFKPYLTLNAHLIDFIENIEKAFAGEKNTSLRSKDNMVLLNHLRIKHNAIMGWDIAHKEHSVILKPKITPGTPAQYKILDDIIKKYHLSKLVTIVRDGSHIALEIKAQHFSSLQHTFNEDILKEEFHTKDDALYKNYRALEHIETLIAQFHQLGVPLALRKLEDGQHQIIATKTIPNQKTIFKHVKLGLQFPHQKLSTYSSDLAKDFSVFNDYFTKRSSELNELIPSVNKTFSTQITFENDKTNRQFKIHTSGNQNQQQIDALHAHLIDKEVQCHIDEKTGDILFYSIPYNGIEAGFSTFKTIIEHYNKKHLSEEDGLKAAIKEIQTVFQVKMTLSKSEEKANYTLSFKLADCQYKEAYHTLTNYFKLQKRKTEQTICFSYAKKQIISKQIRSIIQKQRSSYGSRITHIIRPAISEFYSLFGTSISLDKDHEGKVKLTIFSENDPAQEEIAKDYLKSMLGIEIHHFNILDLARLIKSANTSYKKILSDYESALTKEIEAIAKLMEIDIKIEKNKNAPGFLIKINTDHNAAGFLCKISTETNENQALLFKEYLSSETKLVDFEEDNSINYLIRHTKVEDTIKALKRIQEKYKKDKEAKEQKFRDNIEEKINTIFNNKSACSFNITSENTFTYQMTLSSQVHKALFPSESNPLIFSYTDITKIEFLLQRKINAYIKALPSNIESNMQKLIQHYETVSREKSQTWNGFFKNTINQLNHSTAVALQTSLRQWASVEKIAAASVSELGENVVTILETRKNKIMQRTEQQYKDELELVNTILSEIDQLSRSEREETERSRLGTSLTIQITAILKHYEIRSKEKNVSTYLKSRSFITSTTNRYRPGTADHLSVILSKWQYLSNIVCASNTALQNDLKVLLEKRLEYITREFIHNKSTPQGDVTYYTAERTLLENAISTIAALTRPEDQHIQESSKPTVLTNTSTL